MRKVSKNRLFGDPPRVDKCGTHRRNTENRQQNIKNKLLHRNVRMDVCGKYRANGSNIQKPFPCNNFFRGAFFRVCFKTSINIGHIWFYIRGKLRVFENRGKYRAFSKTTVNIERFWKTSVNIERFNVQTYKHT